MWQFFTFINLEVTIIGTSGTSVTVEAGKRGLKIKPARFIQERKSNHQTKNYHLWTCLKIPIIFLRISPWATNFVKNATVTQIQHVKKLKGTSETTGIR